MKTQAQLTIEMRPVESLIPQARNSRTHTDEQVAQIAASIKEFGWTNPVLLDAEHGIIAGHGRVLAARKLGQAEVPCIELRDMTELQRRAYVIADNKLALNAGWDEELLAIEFAELQENGFDVSLVGFSVDEIALVLNGWNSDIDVVDRHGENLDGIGAVLKVRVSKDDEMQAREVITNALEQAGVVYEL